MKFDLATFEQIHHFSDTETCRRLSIVDRQFFAFSLLSQPRLELDQFTVSILEHVGTIFGNFKTSQLLLSNCFLPPFIHLPHIDSIFLRNFAIDEHFLHFIYSVTKLYPGISNLSFSHLDWPVSIEFKTILLERYSLARWELISESISKWYTNDFGQLAVHARNHVEIFRMGVQIAKTVGKFRCLKRVEFIDSPNLACAWKPMTRSGDPLQTFIGLLLQLLPTSVDEIAIVNSGIWDETILGFQSCPSRIRRIDLRRNHITDFGLELLLNGFVGSACELNVSENLIALKSMRLKNLGDLKVVVGPLGREETRDLDMLDSVLKNSDPDFMMEEEEEDDSDFRESGDDEEGAASCSESSTDQSMSSGFASEGSDLLKLLDD
jgi:hypothetical protein